MELKPLHRNPAFMNECAYVLNEEWKRSLTARLHSLEKSRDGFPICLVLLMKNDNGEQFVVGHSMLSAVRGQAAQSCLVESVVVKKSHRGQGYGRIVMNKTEEFAASQGYKVMYLTTHDKQKFYEHLGYEYCSPIVTFSTDIIPEHLVNKLIGNLGSSSKDKGSEPQEENVNEKGKSGVKNESNSVKLVDNSGDCETSISDRLSSLTMSDNIPSNSSLEKQGIGEIVTPPPPPFNAPPPPPPPPVIAPVVIKSSDGSQGNDKVTRWDPALVSWMKKTIS